MARGLPFLIAPPLETFWTGSSSVDQVFRSQIEFLMKHLTDRNHVPSSSSVVERGQLQGPQSVRVGQVFTHLHQLRRSALDPLNEKLVRPVKRPPNDVPILQVWSHQRLVENRHSCVVSKLKDRLMTGTT